MWQRLEGRDKPIIANWRYHSYHPSQYNIPRITMYAQLLTKRTVLSCDAKYSVIMSQSNV